MLDHFFAEKVLTRHQRVNSHVLLVVVKNALMILAAFLTHHVVLEISIQSLQQNRQHKSSSILQTPFIVVCPLRMQQIHASTTAQMAQWTAQLDLHASSLLRALAESLQLILWMRWIHFTVELTTLMPTKNVWCHAQGEHPLNALKTSLASPLLRAISPVM
jgi:hypothetical protein